MAASISIERSQVVNPDTGIQLGWHLYLVFRPDGAPPTEWKVIRAGPRDENTPTGKILHVNADVNLQDLNNILRAEGVLPADDLTVGVGDVYATDAQGNVITTAAERGSRVLFEGTTSDMTIIWARLTAHAEDIQAFQYYYDGIGDFGASPLFSSVGGPTINSNSFVASLLAAEGIDVNAGFLPFDLFIFPMVGEDTRISGLATHELVGSHGNDTFLPGFGKVSDTFFQKHSNPLISSYS